MRKAVNQLDQTVLEIRTSIFGLRAADDTGVRRRLLRVVPGHMGEHAEAVIRELLSNARRHAQATQVALEIDAADAFAITVVDDRRHSGDVADAAAACVPSRD